MLAGVNEVLRAGFGLTAAEHKEVFCYLLTLACCGLAYVAAVGVCTASAVSSGCRPAGPRADGQFRPGDHRPRLHAQRQQQPAHPDGGGRHSPESRGAGPLAAVPVGRRPAAADWDVGRFAYALEQPTGGLLLAAAAVAAAVRLRRPSAVVWVGLAALPWMALHHALVYSYAGTLGPPNADPAVFDYPGSQFDAHNLTGRWNHAGPGDFALYAFLLLFGQRGFVLSNPTLLAALPAAVWALRHPGRPPWRRPVSDCGGWASGWCTRPCPTTTAASVARSAGSCRCWRRPTTGWRCCSAIFLNTGSILSC